MITNRTLLFIIGTVLLYQLARPVNSSGGSEEANFWFVGTVIFAIATVLNLVADYQKWRLFSRARKKRRRPKQRRTPS